MKRFLCIFAAVLLCFGALIAHAAAPRYRLGDADGDDEVLVMDATKVQRVLLDIDADDDGMAALRGDVNKNGLDIADATLIQRYVARMPVAFPVGTWISPEEPTEAPTKTSSDPYELPIV